MSLNISRVPTAEVEKTDDDDDRPDQRATAAEGDIEEENLRRTASRLSQQVKLDTSIPDALRPSRPSTANAELDPNDPRFNSRSWAKMMLRTFDQSGGSLQRSGIVLKEVTVWTPGVPQDVSDGTVASVIPAKIKGLFSRRRRVQTRSIRNVDVLLKSGEMLVVLGRPGSGCSTLLRSISGALENMSIDDASTIHYNGIPQRRMLEDFRGEVRSAPSEKKTSRPTDCRRSSTTPKTTCTSRISP